MDASCNTRLASRFKKCCDVVATAEIAVISMKKIIYVVPLVVLAVLAVEYFHSTKVEVDNSVKPYLEKFLDLTIEKNHKVIYETYLHEHALSLEEFSMRMNYFANIFVNQRNHQNFSSPYFKC